ncbi:MAG: hypothetical protein NTX82_00890 [Candidatus Parcubacteria bacterium]|nr:hypothetical protein [Candidatus Parcubacteria bacterium]
MSNQISRQERIQSAGWSEDSLFNFIPGSDSNSAIAKIQWLISKPGISQGIWTLNLCYNFQTQELVGKLELPDTVVAANVWEHFQFSTNDDLREYYFGFTFTPELLEFKESVIMPIKFDQPYTCDIWLGVKWGSFPYQERLPILTLGQGNNPVDIMIYSEVREEFYPPDIVSDNELLLSNLIFDHLGRRISFKLDPGSTNQKLSGKIFSLHGENLGIFSGCWDQKKLHLEFRDIPENTYFIFEDGDDGVWANYRLISII